MEGDELESHDTVLISDAGGLSHTLRWETCLTHSAILYRIAEILVPWWLSDGFIFKNLINVGRIHLSNGESDRFSSEFGPITSLRPERQCFSVMK